MQTVDGSIVKKSGSIKPTPTPVPVPSGTPGPELLFEDDFEGTSITYGTNSHQLVGWSLSSHPSISYLGFNNSGTTAYAYQDIVPDPAGTGRSVLYAESIDDDTAVSATSRAQMSINISTSHSVYHSSHRMYLHPDLDALRNRVEKQDWFTLFEIWNAHNAAWDGDPAGSARWSFTMYKNAGAGQPFIWKIDGQYRQPEAVKEDHLLGPHYNSTVPVPLGQWFTLDMYMKRGEGTDGHLVIKITPDGGAQQVLFDIHENTQYPGRPEFQLKSWQPFKLYTSDIVMDWMRGQGKTIGVYYNDFKFYLY